VLYLFLSIKQRVCFSFHALQERFSRWIKPPTTSLLLGTLADVTRGKSELLAENALLRHQLIILHRRIKRPVYPKTDRFLLVLLARMVRTWKEALFLVQPETDLAVQPQLVVDNLISLCKPTSGSFFIIGQSRQSALSWNKAPSDDFCLHFHRPPHGMTLQPHLA
jgi:hypothetical protein